MQSEIWSAQVGGRGTFYCFQFHRGLNGDEWGGAVGCVTTRRISNARLRTGECLPSEN
jgi:hypothetical protein